MYLFLQQLQRQKQLLEQQKLLHKNTTVQKILNETGSSSTDPAEGDEGEPHDEEEERERDDTVGDLSSAAKWRATIEDLRNIPIDENGVWHT